MTLSIDLRMNDSSRPQDTPFIPSACTIKQVQQITRMASESIDPVIQRMTECAEDDEIKLAYVRHVTRLSELIKEVETGLAVGENAEFFRRIHDSIQRHRNAIHAIQRTQKGYGK